MIDGQVKRHSSKKWWRATVAPHSGLDAHWH